MRCISNDLFKRLRATKYYSKKVFHFWTTNNPLLLMWCKMGFTRLTSLPDREINMHSRKTFKHRFFKVTP